MDEDDQIKLVVGLTTCLRRGVKDCRDLRIHPLHLERLLLLLFLHLGVLLGFLAPLLLRALRVVPWSGRVRKHEWWGDWQRRGACVPIG